MKKILWLSTFLFLGITTFAQSDDYFQQEVNYTINVTLDDTAHALTGRIAIEYTNNSPNPLPFIYFHLWANAYKNNQTALAKQKLRLKETGLQYASAKKRGYMDQLDFQAGGQQLNWQLDPENIDIAIVNLKKPLQSGETITITTPFYVKIPYSYSRLGHVKTSYQMTQWYPKPAVYDKNGWHPMPYLDLGEFYSEFGTFDVSITLPENYVVGATGTLQTESEKDFLAKRIEITNNKIKANTIGKEQAFPASSDVYKTLRYTAENLHDFAWFADKRFYVQQDEVTLASGKKVETYVMFTHKEADLWKNAINYVNRSVVYYSERVGEYPYPHATAIQSALSAGAGMEYPMITVIGLSGDAAALDNVITHEVGHNWFYGILGSNERDFAWMDEGLNSFYEEAYMKKYYPQTTTLNESIGFLNFFVDQEIPVEQGGYLLHLYQARRGMQQSMTTTSNDFDMINYQMNSYTMPAFNLRYLQAYVGEETFDKMMQTYFEKWQFKHPQPEDLKAVFEEVGGEDLSWLFDDLFNSTKKLDYKIKGLVTDTRCFCVEVENNGTINAPFSISTIKNDSIIATKWYQPKDDNIYELQVAGDEYVVDAIGVMPEINRRNNTLKAKGLLKKIEPFQLKFLGSLENPKKTPLYFMPTIGFNNYDKFMAGLAFYNSVFPAKNFEFVVMPMYGFNSEKMVGFADLNYYAYPKKSKIHRFQVGLTAKSFHKNEAIYDDSINIGTVSFERFVRYTPSLSLQFKPSKSSSITQEVKLQVHFLSEENPIFTNQGVFEGKGVSQRMIPTLTYSYQNARFLNPYGLKVELLQESYSKFNRDENYLRASVEGYYRVHYNRRKKAADFRLFVGKFLSNSDKDFGLFPFTLAGINETDFYYDAPYLGRNEQMGFYARQVHLGDGHFKAPSHGFSIESNDFMFTANFKTDLPMNLPLNLPVKYYLDFGVYRETAPTASKNWNTLISSGVMLDFGNGIFSVYVPLFGNEAMNRVLKSNRTFGERITFSLDLSKIYPFQFNKRNVL